MGSLEAKGAVGFMEKGKKEHLLQPDGAVFALLALFVALFYVAVASAGGVYRINQALLAFMFVPAAYFWRVRPVPSALMMLALLYLWSINWMMALPENLGVTPFILFLLVVAFSTSRYLKSISFSIIFGGASFFYCLISPLMWQPTENGLLYRSLGQSISWILVQWLLLLVIMQAGRRIQKESERKQREQREKEKAAIDAMAVVQNRERMETAREIHDILAHSLTLINVQASAGIVTAQAQSPELGEDFIEMLKNIRSISADSLSEVRGIVKTLRSGTDAKELGGMGKIADIPVQIERFTKTGMKIETLLPSKTNLTHLINTLPVLVQLAIRRVLDESLTNALRHQGHDSEVAIEIEVDKEKGEILISISSRGKKTEPSEIKGSGSGLIGMKERVESLGGWISYQQGSDCFVVNAMIPTVLET